MSFEWRKVRSRADRRIEEVVGTQLDAPAWMRISLKPHGSTSVTGLGRITRKQRIRVLERADYDQRRDIVVTGFSSASPFEPAVG